MRGKTGRSLDRHARGETRMDEPEVSSLGRRDLLKVGGGAVAAGSGLPLLDPKPAAAQTPKRGGTFRVRLPVNPVHFDPQQTLAFPTMVAMSFTHSRLVKVKAGPAVNARASPIEPGLAGARSHPRHPPAPLHLPRGARCEPQRTGNRPVLTRCG